jgi:hypothetical protein
MDVQFGLSGLKVDVAEWLKTSDLQSRKFNEHTTVMGESFKVDMTLTIQVGAHLLNLKIGHIVYASAQRAFMRTLTMKLKTLNQSPAGKHLTRRAYDLA